jgi:hypothetical protein
MLDKQKKEELAGLIRKLDPGNGPGSDACTLPRTRWGAVCADTPLAARHAELIHLARRKRRWYGTNIESGPADGAGEIPGHLQPQLQAQRRLEAGRPQARLYQ